MDLPSYRRRMRFVHNGGTSKAMRVGKRVAATTGDLEPPRPARRVRDLIPEDTRETAFALGKRTKAKSRRRRRGSR